MSGIGDKISLCRFFSIDGVHMKLLAALLSTTSGLSSWVGEPHDLIGVVTFMVDRIMSWGFGGIWEELGIRD